MTEIMRQHDRNSLDLLAFSSALQRRHEGATSIAERKEKGQVFTPPAVGRFMASLFSRFPRQFRLLDPGAGLGSLSAAVCERIARLRTPHSCEFHLFETDPVLTALLHENMEHCRNAMEQAGHQFAYGIHQEDFLLGTDRPSGQLPLFEDDDRLGDFDAVIMNPPYFKVGGSSRYARRMADVVHGQPNIYALFLARAAEMMRRGGELVAITPRSFCNGLYFRTVRRWFLSRMALRHIHLFESRKDTFKEASVLQESLITSWQRQEHPAPNVTVSTSSGLELPQRSDFRTVASSRILDDSCDDMVVRILATNEDSGIIDLVESWPNRFAELGLRISTGPVVLFRATRFLLEKPNGNGSIPLLTIHNVKRFATVWPVEKKNKPMAFHVCPDSLRLLVPSRNYVLLRRFSAKEERRRLTASYYLRDDAAQEYVALENHLNYVYHAERELSVNETYGLAALFNSVLFDRYFRTISGNTQVNATEIRTMRFPDLGTVATIGRLTRKLRDLNSEQVEKIVLEELQIDTTLKRHLVESNL